MFYLQNKCSLFCANSLIHLPNFALSFPLSSSFFSFYITKSRKQTNKKLLFGGLEFPKQLLRLSFDLCVLNMLILRQKMSKKILIKSFFPHARPWLGNNPLPSVSFDSTLNWLHWCLHLEASKDQRNSSMPASLYGTKYYQIYRYHKRPWRHLMWENVYHYPATCEFPGPV